MAGKGSKLRKGANLKSYWNNFPFEERNTVSYWATKLGETVDERGEFSFLVPGTRLTEAEFLDILAQDREGCDTVDVMSDKDVAEMKECMNSMSFSEFEKIARP